MGDLWQPSTLATPGPAIQDQERIATRPYVPVAKSAPRGRVRIRRTSLALARRWTADEPANTDARGTDQGDKEDVKPGDAYWLLAHDWAEARHIIFNAIAIARRLLANAPARLQDQFSLAIPLFNCGEYALRAGYPAEAGPPPGRGRATRRQAREGRSGHHRLPDLRPRGAIRDRRHRDGRGALRGGSPSAPAGPRATAKPEE